MSTNPSPIGPRIAGASLTGVLIVLAFPRYGFEVGLDGLIWIALLPLFLAATGAGCRRGLLLGWCTGLLLESAGFIWILLAIRRFTGLPSVVASLLFFGWLLYASIPWCILGAALGKCSRPSSILWVLPLWVGVEQYFPRLFPWHLGGALYGREWIVQCADIAGASGLTALVFLSSAVLFLLVGFARRSNRFPVAPLAGFVLLAGAAFIYGRLRFPELEEVEARAPRLRVLLVQGALGVKERSERGLEVYLDRTKTLLSEGPQPDLIVWPEGADHLGFNLTSGSDPWSLHMERNGEGWTPVRLQGVLPAPLITGGGAYVEGRVPEGSNAVVYVEPGKPPHFYEKNCRLLFGEQVPLVDWLPVSVKKNLLAHIGTIAAGTTNPPMRLKDATFRNLICYEAVLPDYVRANAKGTDFFVNVTEDIWYGRTAHISQHVSVLILRAIENRVPIVRCANMGPSGVVDICGQFRRGEKIFEPEAIRAEVKAGSVRSLYRAGGYLFPLGALLLAVGRWAVQRWGLRRQSQVR